MKKITLVILVLQLVLPGIASAKEARTLKERIRSVSNRLYAKSGRVELTLLPLTSLSLNDAFYQKLGGGLAFAYHLSDAFSIQLMGSYSLNVENDNASYFGTKEKTTIPYAGKRTFLIGADFCWAPIYGKMSLAAEWIMHFDTYLLVGIGAVGGEQVEGDSSVGVAGSVGVGARVFFSPTFALKLELKDYMLFNDKVSFNQIEKSDVQHQLLFNLGLSIFFLDADGES